MPLQPRQAAPVGVVIPTYNRVAFLKEALASVLDQSHGNLRVVVVDDASPDETGPFLAGVKDPRFSFVVNDRNLGLSGSINKGISLLPEEVSWCTILCDDDCLDRDYLATMIAAVGERGIREVAYGRIKFIDVDGTPVRDAAVAPERESALEYLRSRALGTRDTYLAGGLFSRDAFRRIGGYPVFTTGMATDDAFLFALALPGGLSHVAEARVMIRVHGEAESQQVTGIPAHLQAVREFGAFCLRQGAAFSKEAAFGAELAEVTDTLMRRLGNLLWLRGERFLRKRKGKSEQHRQELATLHALAINHEWNFSGRIRLDGWARRLTGISLEGIGLYRYLWEKVLKISPGKG